MGRRESYRFSCIFYFGCGLFFFFSMEAWVILQKSMLQLFFLKIIEISLWNFLVWFLRFYSSLQWTVILLFLARGGMRRGRKRHKCKGQSDKWHHASASGCGSDPTSATEAMDKPVSSESVRWGRRSQRNSVIEDPFTRSPRRTWKVCVGNLKAGKESFRTSSWTYHFSEQFPGKGSNTGKKRVKNQPLWTLNHLFNCDWLSQALN